MNEPGMLAIKAINQAVARERYGEGGKALEGSPPGETGRGSDEYNRKSVVIFQKGKKKILLQQFLGHQLLLHLQLHVDTSL